MGNGGSGQGKVLKHWNWQGGCRAAARRGGFHDAGDRDPSNHHPPIHPFPLSSIRSTSHHPHGMIIRSFARRHNAIPTLLSTATTRPVAAAAARQSPVASILLARNVHKVPALHNHQSLQKNGIPGLLSPKAFDIAFTQYHQHLVNELNSVTTGTPYENQTPESLAVEFARDPNRAYLFNLASNAYNNAFFFNGINTDPNITSVPSSDLKEEIVKNFNSLETMRDEILGIADAMFGPGYVWVVQDSHPRSTKMRVLTTYIAGSPLAGAHNRRQEHDLNTQNADSYQQLNGVGSFGASARKPNAPLDKEKTALGGANVTPLLCVNTWQHVWLPDYGVTGKMDYLEAWWNKINWNVVLQLARLHKDISDKKFRFQS
ncbi:manganese and iron superoxide dismutase [Periconia macrospinosa]|uniref:Manganese and iron superoxide dismutase n=1 Tax=Periconia macrospinosa TaxID=97972 RepID=A0A2V1DPU6_9PLEO|nr:manganese and iron superoxide dismutase [Periconia macrospinosa]